MTRVAADAQLREHMRAKGLAQAMCFSWERSAREALSAFHNCVLTTLEK